MEPLLIATTDLVALVPPSRIEAIAERIRMSSAAENDGSLRQFVTTPAARAALDRLLTSWRQTPISGDVLAGILAGSAFAFEKAKRESSVEFVWTGPTTPFVATRRTEQVLLDVIHNAKSDLFLVSFVVYDVSSVVEALNAAALRGVGIQILLETSTTHGGSLSVDPVATMQSSVPMAALYVWTDRSAPFVAGRVHAKLAVADASAAFLTSANLTGHALEKNMEAGVILQGGRVPQNLRDHLQALVDMKIIRKVGAS